MHITVWNKELEAKVVAICERTDWNKLCENISTPKLQVWRVYKYLKEQIPELD